MVRFILVFLLLGLTGYVGAQEIKIEKSTEKIVYQGKSYYLHTVKAKETLFSICKAYGVSVDEVKILNDKSDNALSIGDVLRIPVVEPFKSIDDKFYYHRMKPKETLYSLSRKFNIKMKRILKDNPEYDVSRPIAEGAVVKLALRQIDRNVLEAELRWEKRQAKEVQQARREEMEKHYDNIVDFSELENFMDVPVKNFSSGMVSRLAFAIATIGTPDILIVDEVLSVGDFRFQQKCEERIRKMMEHGTTILFVSHSIAQVESLCEKIVWLEHGHVKRFGDAEEICKEYSQSY